MPAIVALLRRRCEIRVARLVSVELHPGARPQGRVHRFRAILMSQPLQKMTETLNDWTLCRVGQSASWEGSIFQRGPRGLSRHCRSHLSERLDDLAAAREAVASSPDILGGTPVIHGTRIPVYDVAASIAAGGSTERILETWPNLNAEKIRLATIYAEANPLRGRPRAFTDLPEGSVILTDRRVPRRGRRDEVSD
ncbi:DUF433 domain-containing protein [Rhizobium grahamii]|uniref:DUF433 domain-containing protein n=1 Tax=Rhizobium grahamii CCGE 502 TaxID=990285 RepID=S3I2C5_9HYPH|nr:hypothetical protein RGCCGE502_34136 [Rhizobium grahamii CCGE 502]